jgi:hypothetical protein
MSDDKIPPERQKGQKKTMCNERLCDNLKRNLYVRTINGSLYI